MSISPCVRVPHVHFLQEGQAFLEGLECVRTEFGAVQVESAQRLDAHQGSDALVAHWRLTQVQHLPINHGTRVRFKQSTYD